MSLGVGNAGFVGESRTVRKIVAEIKRRFSFRQYERSDPGRKRHRQRVGLSRHPSRKQPRSSPLHPGQLRCYPSRARRVDVVRPRARGLHRRDERSERMVRTGEPRNLVPGRNRRHANVAAGQVAKSSSEDGEILSVRSAKPVKVDVRVIAASNADLPTKILDGSFRQDLLFSPAPGMSVETPPLRDRLHNLPLLVSHFLQLFANEMGMTRAVRNS